MSLKTLFFDNKLKSGPAVRHNYLVHIPGFTHLAYLVSGAPIPTPSRGMSSISFMGETFSFPVAVDLAAGEFQATFYEAATGEVAHAYYDSFVNDVSKGVKRIFDVEIYSFQMNYAFPVHTRLLGCWVKSFSGYSLDSSAFADVVTSTVTLHYNGVELVEDTDNHPEVNLAKGRLAYDKQRQAISSLKYADPIANALGLNTSVSNVAKTGDILAGSISSGLALLNSIIK